MPSILTPYISYRDNARQALEFYHSVLGGKLDMMTFKDFHVSEDPSEENKIMHGQLDTPNGMTLMAADTPNAMPYTDGSRISITLSGEDHAELSAYYQKLSAGGMVVEPLEKAPWGDYFGMFVDKFGVNWMVNISAPKA